VTNVVVLEHAHTEIGTIYLERRESSGTSGVVYQIQINGQLLMSSIAPVSERRLSTSGLLLRGGDDEVRVLVGGLGLGHTAEAALASPRVTSVRVVEKMDFVLDWMNGGLLPLSELLCDNDRVEIVKGDIYEELLAPPKEKYDLILVDVDHAPDDPLSPASLPFYTVEGQTQVAAHLNPYGVIGIWSAHDNEAFAEAMAHVYSATEREDVCWESPDEPGATLHDVLFFGRCPVE